MCNRNDELLQSQLKDWQMDKQRLRDLGGKVQALEATLEKQAVDLEQLLKADLEQSLKALEVTLEKQAMDLEQRLEADLGLRLKVDLEQSLKAMHGELVGRMESLACRVQELQANEGPLRAGVEEPPMRTLPGDLLTSASTTAMVTFGLAKAPGGRSRAGSSTTASSTALPSEPSLEGVTTGAAPAEADREVGWSGADATAPGAATCLTESVIAKPTQAQLAALAAKPVTEQADAAGPATALAISPPAPVQATAASDLVSQATAAKPLRVQANPAAQDLSPPITTKPAPSQADTAAPAAELAHSNAAAPAPSTLGIEPPQADAAALAAKPAPPTTQPNTAACLPPVMGKPLPVQGNAGTPAAEPALAQADATTPALASGITAELHRREECLTPKSLAAKATAPAVSTCPDVTAEPPAARPDDPAPDFGEVVPDDQMNDQAASVALEARGATRVEGEELYVDVLDSPGHGGCAPARRAHGRGGQQM